VAVLRHALVGIVVHEKPVEIALVGFPGNDRRLVASTRLEERAIGLDAIAAALAPSAVAAEATVEERRGDVAAKAHGRRFGRGRAFLLRHAGKRRERGEAEEEDEARNENRESPNEAERSSVGPRAQAFARMRLDGVHGALKLSCFSGGGTAIS